ncbi:hypothetical protein K432DRAFT_335180 [Lepidopterella palustris CBS 459.81]|uniref:Methyltransferase domain-containing protein n=1 Tax=Lepidopterella palustris CBS 459.81 TaxID=1314670 RepID=A0A8E2E3W4_9PEZI|nr:hypothetical protein K432DRAFT_335180 [Lepidopterella palustris CBS 459.81]
MTIQENEERDEYIFSREFKDSARLHLQHWMWKFRLGWSIHPAIPVPQFFKEGELFRIADIGTGNGCYLTEVNHELNPLQRSHIHLHGFDISSNQFPHPAWRPSNLRLSVFDAFGPIPDKYIGAFDIVHVRAFTCVVKGNDPGSLITNAWKMLKPGGHFQWDEMDSATFAATSPNEETSNHYTKLLLEKFQAGCKGVGLQFGWVSQLAEHFQKNGFAVRDSIRLPISDELRKASTDNFLMGLEDMGKVLTERDERILESKRQFNENFMQALQETGKGVSLHMEMVIVVGRKDPSEQ